MSHFLREFEALIDEYKAGSGTSVFKIAGLDRSTLSRIRSAKGKLVFEDIAPLAVAIGSDDMIYLRLLRARLLDECDDPRAEKIDIQISGTRRKLGSPQRDSLSTLPPEHEKAIRNIIGLMPYDAGFRGTVLWLGDMAGNARNENASQSADDSGADGPESDGGNRISPPPPAPSGPVNLRQRGRDAEQKMSHAVKNIVSTLKQPPAGGKSAKE